MDENLFVTYTRDNDKNESGLCVARRNDDGTTSIIKMALDEQAEKIYTLLTRQDIKI